ncbi:MAG TPA: methyltransferase domain-containing protein, partial [Bacilli bacterium]|nr:methyltransferase domain-containing protein [Bacilli bacterium]
TNITIKLYDYIKSLINKNDNVLDLYCGIGSITIYIADKCNNVYGVEIINDAILNANENKKLNNIDNIEFKCNDISKILNQYKDIDTIVLDPPRIGINKIALNNILEIDAKHIVYISCNSTTLARDLNIFKDKYNIISLKLFDMFPNTNHIESVVLLERK